MFLAVVFILLPSFHYPNFLVLYIYHSLAEDPATGIAAAALAASLKFGGDDDISSSSSYNIYQGTAMGRPSLIQVIDLKKERDDERENNCDKKTINSGAVGVKVSFGLQGCVEIDDYTSIEVR